jgi:arginase family enzyme
MIEDGIRIVSAREVDRLGSEVRGTEADGWYLHIDCSLLSRSSAPGADDAVDRGLDPARLIEAVREAFAGSPLRAVAVVGYDLNADATRVTTGTVLGLVEAAARVAGGVPRPETVSEAGG